MTPALPQFQYPRIEFAGAGAAIAVGLVLAVAPRGFVIAAFMFVFVALVSAWRPSLGLSFLILSVPVQTSLILAVGSRDVTLTKLVLVAVAIGWIAKVVTTRAYPPVTGISVAFVLYILALIASVWNAVNRGAWAGETYRWLTAALVYVIASQSIRRRSDLLAVLAATSSAVIACGIVALIQVMNHSGPPSFTVNGVTRAFGAFGEPNPFAAYFEIAALPLIGFLAALGFDRFWSKNRMLFIALAAPSAFGLSGVYLTHSRGGAIGALAGLLSIGLLVDRRSRAALLFSAGLLALALVISGSSGAIVNRIEPLGGDWRGSAQVTPSNFSVEERVAHWGAALKMWEQHPIIGIGAGNFNDNFRRDTPVWRFRIPRGHAHNGYLQAAAQAGTVGLIAYLSLLIASLAQAGRCLRIASNPLERGIAIGTIAATVVVMAHGMFDYLHVLNLGLQLSVAWGMLEFIRPRSDHGAKGNHHV